MHRKFWWRRQYVGQISGYQEIVQIKGRFQTTEWEEDIIVPLGGGKLLFIMVRFRPDLETAVSFLTTRGSKSDIDDWKIEKYNKACLL